MNKESLKEYLSSRYQGWSSFLNNVIFPIFGEDDFEDGYETELLESQPERRQLAETTGIRSIKQVGMMYVGVEPLQIFDVAVSNRVMMERNRVNIQRLIRSVMDKFSCAFILFHYENDTRWDWRFTYCRMGANDKDSTDSKRYTFLLGPGQSCRTVVENFLKLAEKREDIEIADIESAFSVEALSDEFFSKYKAQYEKFVCFITGKKYVKNGNKYEEKVINDPHPVMYEAFNKDDKLVRDYIKQMLGRITFLHFLQKKGWMGVPEGRQWGEGDLQFMRNLFIYATDEQKGNFLDAVLEPLYDKGLDTDRSANNDLFDTGVALEQGSRVRIPYLNGGLFERNSLDEIPTRFPADYFSELFEFFYQYNFTIDENDPSEAQVGVDPEMLGRIFENLLEDNKDKGAYYTPKEIVRYMCRQSLIAYLQTDVESEADREAISQFVGKYDASLLPAPLVLDIDERLKEVKVCDPAIGSGAFPMGMLKEIFLCRGAIENFDKAADIKRHIIQNNIYGVDIERGAVDIARLRFWLSLVVDEESPETLPNFDFKIMQGNSLLEQYEGIDLSKLATLSNVQFYEPQRNLFGEIEDKQLKMTFAQTDALQEFQNNLKKYFSEDRHNEKKDLRESIEMFVRDTIAYTLESKQRGLIHSREMINASGTLNDKQMKTLQKLDAEIERLNQLVQDATQMDIPNDKFFLWHTWFADVLNRPSDCNGFDIVIGNPPYVNVQLMSVDEKKIYKTCFTTFFKRCDMFCLFMELSLLKLASEKGIVTLIVPSVIHSNLSYKKIRNIILDNHWLQEVHYTGGDVFNAPTVDTTILICNKKGNNFIKLTNAIDFAHPQSHYVAAEYFQRFDNLISIGNDNGNSIYDKLFNPNFETLGEHYKVFQGIVTGNNPAFIFETEEKALSHHIDVSLLHPLCHGRDLEKYYIRNRERRILYVNDEVNIDFYPQTKEWLSVFKDALVKRREVKRGVIKWYSLQWPRIKSELDLKEKILVQNTRNESLNTRIVATIDDYSVYGTQGINFIIPMENDSLRFLLGILNSKLINYLFATKFLNLAIKADYLKQVRLPNVSSAEKQKLENLVDSILNAKEKGENTSELESSVDSLIYKIYELTEEEIRIVEQQ